METVLLEPGNPYDISREDLEPLRAAMEAGGVVNARVAFFPPKGAGVTFDEVLNIWVPGVEFLRDEGYSILLGLTLEYMRGRFSRRHGKERRKVIIVRAENGKQLEVVTIDSVDKPEVRETPQNDDARPMPPVQH